MLFFFDNFWKKVSGIKNVCILYILRRYPTIHPSTCSVDYTYLWDVWENGSSANKFFGCSLAIKNVSLLTVTSNFWGKRIAKVNRNTSYKGWDKINLFFRHWVGCFCYTSEKRTNIKNLFFKKPRSALKATKWTMLYKPAYARATAAPTFKKIEHVFLYVISHKGCSCCSAA